MVASLRGVLGGLVLASAGIALTGCAADRYAEEPVPSRYMSLKDSPEAPQHASWRTETRAQTRHARGSSGSRVAMRPAPVEPPDEPDVTPPPVPMPPRAAVAPAAPVAPPPTAAAPVVPKPPVPAPQSSEAGKTVIERAELLLRSGNVAGARTMLEPAAAANDPDAIAALGRTYDPLELESYLVPAGVTDGRKAAEYYVRAAALGSAVARTRLQRLRDALIVPQGKP